VKYPKKPTRKLIKTVYKKRVVINETQISTFQTAFHRIKMRREEAKTMAKAVALMSLNKKIREYQFHHDTTKAV
jgi:hypothetical protein